MGITTNKGKSENWGMGLLLLVFFPEDHHLTTATSSSSSSSPFKSTLTPLRRTSPNQPFLLLTKTQSALSVCFLLFLLSLLLFSLLGPSPSSPSRHRRHLLGHPYYKLTPSPPSFALQKMGVLHRRGTKAMPDLLVGHVSDSLSPHHLRLFLRLYLFSNFTSKSDLVFLFPRSRDPYLALISEEIDSFSRLNSSRYAKPAEKAEDPFWGVSSKRTRPENSPVPRQSHGSIASFLADELDPENSLSGFLDHVAMSTRRWACYPMLLGRVRRSFKHVALLDVGEVLLLGDPLGHVRNWPSESVQLSLDASRHGKRHVAETVSQRRVDSVMVLGGIRGVRRLANAMLTEIVRSSATTGQRKRKGSVSELAVFNQLARNEHLLKSANVNVFTEPVPDVSSLGRINSSLAKITAVRRGNSDSVEVNAVIRKHICSLVPVNHSSVYSDC